MYPLLVSGIASVASNLLDTWSRASERKTAAEVVKFQDLLDRVVGPAKAAGAGAGAVSPLEARIAELRTRLLDAPEVRTLVDSSDPSKAPTLQVGPDGKLVAQTAGGLQKTLTLSPENEALAQELARLLSAAPGGAGAGALTSVAGIARAKHTPQ